MPQQQPPSPPPSTTEPPSSSSPPSTSKPPSPSSSPPPPPPKLQSLLSPLPLHPHTEGGYYHEAFRHPHLIPSPFPPTPASPHQYHHHEETERPDFHPNLRNLSTTILYLLTPGSPVGYFHRNRGTTLHVLHRGRGRYVVIHPGDKDKDGEARVETFVVGRNAAAGEKRMWLVEGGRYKATFLEGGGGDGLEREEGMLVSETVVPGFEFFDHEFLVKSGLRELVGAERARGLERLVKE